MAAPLFGLENYLAQQDVEVLIHNDNAMDAIAYWEQAANRRQLRNRINPLSQLVRALSAAGVAAKLVSSIYFAAKRINTGQPPTIEATAQDEFGTMENDLPVETALSVAGDVDMTSPLSNKRSGEQGLSPEDRKPRRTDSRAPVSNLEDRFDAMDEGGDEPMAMMSRGMSVEGDQGSGKKSRSTVPVYSIPRDLELFSQRAMVRMPMTFNFSINKLDMLEPLVFKMKLNQYFNQFSANSFQVQTFPTADNGFLGDYDTTIGTLQPNTSATTRYAGAFRDQDAAGAADNGLYSAGYKFGSNSKTTMHMATGDFTGLPERRRGFSTDKAYDQLYINGRAYPKPVGHNYGAAQMFVRTCPAATIGTNVTTSSGIWGNASGDIRPDWRNYYEFMYQYRHVHKCKWAMTLEDPTTSKENNGVVIWKHETITSTDDGSNTNLVTNKPLHDAQGWPAKKQQITGGSRVNDSWTDTDGTQDIVNEEDIREWYPTSTISAGVVTVVQPTPTYEENLVVLFYGKDKRSNGVNDNGASFFNCRLDVEWHVEYRDIKRTFRDIQRTAANTALIGGTGALSDIYPFFKDPTPGTDWPTERDNHDRACQHGYGTYATLTT